MNFVFSGKNQILLGYNLSNLFYFSTFRLNKLYFRSLCFSLMLEDISIVDISTLLRSPTANELLTGQQETDRSVEDLRKRTAAYLSKTLFPAPLELYLQLIQLFTVFFLNVLNTSKVKHYLLRCSGRIQST